MVKLVVVSSIVWSSSLWCRPSYGQARCGVVPPKAPDIVAIIVVQIRLPHHPIGRRHPRRFPPSAVSVEEQGDDHCDDHCDRHCDDHCDRHCGSEPSGCVQSSQRTFRSAHQGDVYTSHSRLCWMGGGRKEGRVRALCEAGSSALSG